MKQLPETDAMSLEEIEEAYFHGVASIKEWNYSRKCYTYELRDVSDLVYIRIFETLDDYAEEIIDPDCDACSKEAFINDLEGFLDASQVDSINRVADTNHAMYPVISVECSDDDYIKTHLASRTESFDLSDLISLINDAIRVDITAPIGVISDRVVESITIEEI